MTAHFVFLSLFEKGVILYDESGRLEQLKRYVLSSKPWTLKDRDILALRASGHHHWMFCITTKIQNRIYAQPRKPS